MVAIHPSSVITSKPPWVIFQEFVLTSRNYVRTTTAVRLEWLLESAPHYYDLENWPPGETREELEKAYRRIQQEKQLKERKGKK